MSREQGWFVQKCLECDAGVSGGRKLCGRCRRRKGKRRAALGNTPPAQLSHALSSRARKLAREGEARMQRERGGQ
jgi:hypothetical protein